MDLDEAKRIVNGEPDLSFIRGIDFTKPSGETEDGQPYFIARCKVQFTAPMVRNIGLAGLVTADLTAEQRAKMESRAVQRVQIDPGLKIDPSATGDDGSDDEVTAAGGSEGDATGGSGEKNFRLEGIASSTSVDFYGTEMSLQALQGMAKQFSNGVPYIPRHMAGCFHPVEWDGVIGRTIFGDVISSDRVAAAFDASEDQYLLRVVTEIYGDEPKSKALKKRLDRGETIGQSIGGWFTELMFVTDGEGEIVRTVVMGVELDHLALTRAPANPDSNGISLIRSAAAKAYRSAIGMDGMLNLDKLADAPRFILQHAMRGIDEQRSIQSVSTDVVSMIEAGRSLNPMASMDDFLDGVRNEDGQALRHLLGVRDNKDGTVSIILQAGDDEPDEETHSQEGGEARSLDSDVPAEQDPSEDGSSSPEGDRDALGSAPGQDDSTPTDPGGASQERDMSDTKPEGLDLDAFRALLDEKLAPIEERVNAIETARTAAAPPTDTKPADEPEAEIPADFRAKLAQIEARNKALENYIAERNTRSARMGRAGALAMAHGPSKAARSVIERQVAQVRSAGNCFQFADAVERSLDVLTAERTVDGPSVADFSAILRDGLIAAVEDGLIREPAERASWS